MKKIVTSAFICLLFLCLGCVPFHALEHRAPDEKTLSSIKEGATSKEDVLMMLGEPDRVMEKEKFFQYWWKEHLGYIVPPVYLGYIVGYILPPQVLLFSGFYGYIHSLHIYFDENNVIKEFEIRKKFVSDLFSSLPDVFLFELYAGKYVEMEVPYISEIELKEYGNGVWRVADKETSFRWSIGDNEIRLNTKSEVIIGQIVDNILEIPLPADSGYRHFKKAK